MGAKGIDVEKESLQRTSSFLSSNTRSTTSTVVYDTGTLIPYLSWIETLFSLHITTTSRAIVVLVLLLSIQTTTSFTLRMGKFLVTNPELS
jgi:hypothetical protein